MARTPVGVTEDSEDDSSPFLAELKYVTPPIKLSTDQLCHGCHTRAKVEGHSRCQCALPGATPGSLSNIAPGLAAAETRHRHRDYCQAHKGPKVRGCTCTKIEVDRLDILKYWYWRSPDDVDMQPLCDIHNQIPNHHNGHRCHSSCVTQPPLSSLCASQQPHTLRPVSSYGPHPAPADIGSHPSLHPTVVGAALLQPLLAILLLLTVLVSAGFS